MLFRYRNESEIKIIVMFTFFEGNLHKSRNTKVSCVAKTDYLMDCFTEKVIGT
jgi:hypothetical protein